MGVLNANVAHQRYFEELCQIPHGSKNEKAISDYLVNFAHQHNLRCVQDDMHNVIIYKDASKGYEDHPSLMLQAHIDMVCEKNQDVDFNFEQDALRLYIEDGFLKAKGTTLGADDGVGVAYMMAILADEHASHPALECVFTTQEEIGMFGAVALDKELLKARRLINLDGGGETQTLISAAGGILCHFKKEAKTEPCDAPLYQIKVTGLKGGHSGGEIHKERGNANKLIVRILYQLKKQFDVRLVSMNGGLKENAIPREASVEACIMGNKEEVFNIVNKMGDVIKQEYASSDDGVEIEVVEKGSVKTAWSKDDSDALIHALYLMPNGMRHRDLALNQLVDASLNLGVVHLDHTSVMAEISLRAAQDSMLEEMMDEVDLIAKTFHCETSYSSRYPGWAFVRESEMRDKLAAVFEAMYHQPLKLEAVHGGCECGIFKAIDPAMDIVTVGPITNDIHTPQEALDLASFDRTFSLLSAFIETL